MILGLLVILNGLGLSITPMLTALGVGGLAIALALQDTLANLFAGFYLTVAKQIRIGNYIRLSSGEEGYLVDIDWRASRLRQLSNNTVLIPNAKLSQSIVTNYHLPEQELAVVIEASVDYGSDLDKVERITVEVGRDVMRTVPGRRQRLRTIRPLSHARRSRHRLHGYATRARVRRPVSHPARVREAAESSLRKRGNRDSDSRHRATSRTSAAAGSAAMMTRRLYYGWLVLLVAAAAMVGTLPGRTQGLGLITEPLLADLNIGRVAYAQLNLWATLVGSAGAIGVGRLIDRFGSRVVLTLIAAALGGAVCLMSRATSLGDLALTITLTRALGQSALSVVSLAMVGQWFVRRIDMAMAIYSIVMSIGFMIAFPVVGSLVQSRGWRFAWFAVGMAILAGLVPLALLIVRRSPESIGLQPDGPQNPEPGNRNLGRGTRNPEPAGYSLREALFTPAFWVFAIGAALYGLVASGIGLFNESILAERGLGPNIYYQTLVVTAMTGLAGNFLGGWLAGFIPLNRLMAISLLVLTVGLLALPHVSTVVDGHGLGDDDGDRRRAGDGAVLQRMAARIRTPSARTHPGLGAGDHRDLLGGWSAAPGRVPGDDRKLSRGFLHSRRHGRRGRRGGVGGANAADAL